MPSAISTNFANMHRQTKIPRNHKGCVGFLFYNKTLSIRCLLDFRRVGVVTQQWQASLPLPSLLAYFTSSKILHADYQLFTFTWDKYGLLLR